MPRRAHQRTDERVSERGTNNAFILFSIIISILFFILFSYTFFSKLFPILFLYFFFLYFFYTFFILFFIPFSILPCFFSILFFISFFTFSILFLFLLTFSPTPLTHSTPKPVVHRESCNTGPNNASQHGTNLLHRSQPVQLQQHTPKRGPSGLLASLPSRPGLVLRACMRRLRHADRSVRSVCPRSESPKRGQLCSPV